MRCAAGAAGAAVTGVAVGVAAEAAFLGWIVVQGRAASARGVTGELGELDRGWDELATARERAWST